MKKYFTKTRICKDCKKKYKYCTTAAAHNKWKGSCKKCTFYEACASFSKTKNKISGYINIKIPWHPYANGRWVPEHRWIMEKKLRRFLKRGEVVHHINEKRDDNRIENLRLYKDHTTHAQVHSGTYPFGKEKDWIRFIEDIFGVEKYIYTPYD